MRKGHTLSLYLARVTTTKTFAYLSLSLFLISTLAVLISLFVAWHIVLVSLVVSLASGYFVFKDTMNKLQSIGPFYWITRDFTAPNHPVIAKGFMRETASPWRMGTGVQIKLRKHSFQFGVCNKPQAGEERNLLTMLDGHYMDTPPSELRDWKR